MCVTNKVHQITLHLCHLSYDELMVTLYDLALHLNLRPFTPGDGEVLTPAHQLSGVTSIAGVVCPSIAPACSLDRAWRSRRLVSDQRPARSPVDARVPGDAEMLDSVSSRSSDESAGGRRDHPATGRGKTRHVASRSRH